MSAYSTIKVTREKARRYLLNELLSADDVALENMMDAALRKRLYDCRIVSEDAEENDDWIIDL